MLVEVVVGSPNGVAGVVGGCGLGSGRWDQPIAGRLTCESRPWVWPHPQSGSLKGQAEPDRGGQWGGIESK